MTEGLYRLGPHDGERVALLHDHLEHQDTPAHDVLEEPDSWTPINLNTLPDQPPVRPDLGGVGIVYPGKRHVFSGPPEAAKTLAAYAIGLHLVKTGGTLILIDFEMGGHDARERLRELGATTGDLNRIHYLEPAEPSTEPRISLLIGLKPQLVLLDAAAGVYDIEELDDNKRKDVGQIARRYIQPFFRAGIATILIDHVVKNAENRGHFSIGSERKLGGSDVHIGFETVRPISRGNTGLYKLITHKDRGGYFKRGRLADLELESDPETHHITWTLKTPDTATDQAGHHRPTHLMEKVSRYLELQHEPVTRNTIAEALGGTKQWILLAITALVLEGYATETDGPGRSKPVSRTRIYREDDPACNTEIPTGGSVVLSGSERFAEPGAVSGSGGSYPYGDDTTEPHHADHPKQGQWFGDLYQDELAETVDLTQTPGTLDTEETP